jgi:hypothetical protein
MVAAGRKSEMSGENHSFRITLPAGWSDVTTHVFMGPEVGGRRHMLTVSVDPEPSTLDPDDYAEDRLAGVLAALPGAELLKRERLTLADGGEAVEAVVKLAASDAPSFQKLVFVLRDGAAYTFKADFSKQTLKTLGRQVIGMIETLRTSNES